jgi:hypothetical protein
MAEKSRQKNRGVRDGNVPVPAAWEQIEVGRFQPRRIRGSYLGRELG